MSDIPTPLLHMKHTGHGAGEVLLSRSVIATKAERAKKLTGLDVKRGH